MRTNSFQKKLGILGGMGPMASLTLYQKLIEQSKASCDQEHLDIFLYSHATLPDRSTAIASGDCRDIIAKLTADVRLLETMGADFLAIPCNTSHYFYEDMAKSVGIPLLHMVDLTVEEVARQQRKKVAILATEGTQYSRIYQEALEKRNVLYVDTPCFLQDRVNQLIYGEIKEGKLGDRENFQVIEDYLLGQEVDCIILACTELSVFAQQVALSSLYLDSLQVLTEEILSFARQITP